MVYCITQKNKDKGGLASVSCLGFCHWFGAWLDLAFVPGSTWFDAWGARRFKSASQTPLFSFSGVSHVNFEIPIPFPSKSTDFHKNAGLFALSCAIRPRQLIFLKIKLFRTPTPINFNFSKLQSPPALPAPPAVQSPYLQVA